MTKTLDEILVEDRINDIIAELVLSITDTVTPNHLAASKKANEQILQWIADEVIGDDESQIRPDGSKNTQEWTNGRNNQRQQQRNKLKSLGWKG